MESRLALDRRRRSECGQISKPKRRFTTKDEADKEARNLNQRTQGIKPFRRYHAYYCKFCNHFHIGRTRKSSHKEKQKGCDA